MFDVDLNVLIPDGESGHSLVVARCLAEVSRIQLQVMSRFKWTALYFSRRRKKYSTLNTTKKNELHLDALEKAVKQTGANIILPVDEPAVRFISQHHNAIKEIASIAPVPTTQAFDIATDKWLLANFLEENNIPSPRTILYTHDESFGQALNDIDFPVLVKPARGHGGQGIYQFKNPSEVHNFFARLPKASHGRYIVQSFIEGYDIDCSILSQSGHILAYTIQRGFIPRSHTYAAPAGIYFLKEISVLHLVQRLVSTLGFSGIAHIDLRYDTKDSEFKILELNARYWGSLTGSLMAGVNFPYLSCLAALDFSFPVPEFRIGRYIDHSTAIKQIIRKILGKSNINLNYAETDLSFMVADPIAEIFNMYSRWRNP